MSGAVAVELPDKLRSFIETRDRKSAAAAGYRKAPHAENFVRLLAGDAIRVGGRASCGSRVDPSWVEFMAWNEIVRKAQKLGYRITIETIPQKNAWATKAGGFWHENSYQLAAEEQAA